MNAPGTAGEIFPPHHYSEWVPLLERFAGGDDAVLPLLGVGSVDLGPGVAERLTQRVFQTFNARVQEAQRKLQRDLGASFGSTASLSAALVSVRRTLQVLARFAALPALPVQVQDHLRGELERIARALGQDLESSARRQGLAAESLLLVIRQNPLTLPERTPELQAASVSAMAGTGALPDSTPGATRRRIILPHN